MRKNKFIIAIASLFLISNCPPHSSRKHSNSTLALAQEEPGLQTDNADEVIKKLVEANKKVSELLAKKEREIEELKQSKDAIIDNLRQEKNSVYDKLSSTIMERDSLEKELLSLKEEPRVAKTSAASSGQEDFAPLNKKVRPLNEELELLKTHTAYSVKEIESLVNKLAKENAALQKQLSKALEAKAHLQAKIDSLQQKLTKANR